MHVRARVRRVNDRKRDGFFVRFSPFLAPLPQKAYAPRESTAGKEQMR